MKKLTIAISTILATGFSAQALAVDNTSTVGLSGVASTATITQISSSDRSGNMSNAQVHAGFNNHANVFQAGTMSDSDVTITGGAFNDANVLQGALAAENTATVNTTGSYATNSSINQGAATSDGFFSIASSSNTAGTTTTNSSFVNSTVNQGRATA
ncbi:MAG TPA: hypothetical protein DEV85_08510 [Vibrio sp.]|uniref:hypothetical protein n=1 Tax=Vibrio TaxID=662 RepID=UPI000ECF24A4|nr:MULTISPECIES: hypothetical protein [Vibrio]HCH01914.1 hypothetical protein [Vibrio sp.]